MKDLLISFNLLGVAKIFKVDSETREREVSDILPSDLDKATDIIIARAYGDNIFNVHLFGAKDIIIGIGDLLRSKEQTTYSNNKMNITYNYY